MCVARMLTGLTLLGTVVTGAAHAQGVQFGSGTAEGPGWRGGWVGGSIGDPEAAGVGLGVAADALAPWMIAPEPEANDDALGDSPAVEPCLRRLRVHGHWRVVDRCR